MEGSLALRMESTRIVTATRRVPTSSVSYDRGLTRPSASFLVQPTVCGKSPGTSSPRWRSIRQIPWESGSVVIGRGLTGVGRDQSTKPPPQTLRSRSSSMVVHSTFEAYCSPAYQGRVLPSLASYLPAAKTTAHPLLHTPSTTVATGCQRDQDFCDVYHLASAVYSSFLA